VSPRELCVRRAAPDITTCVATGSSTSTVAARCRDPLGTSRLVGRPEPHAGRLTSRSVGPVTCCIPVTVTQCVQFSGGLRAPQATGRELQLPHPGRVARGVRARGQALAPHAHRRWRHRRAPAPAPSGALTGEAWVTRPSDALLDDNLEGCRGGIDFGGVMADGDSTARLAVECRTGQTVNVADGAGSPLAQLLFSDRPDCCAGAASISDGAVASLPFSPPSTAPRQTQLDDLARDGRN
jgi:hypothetical protein